VRPNAELIHIASASPQSTHPPHARDGPPRGTPRAPGLVVYRPRTACQASPHTPMWLARYAVLDGAPHAIAGSGHRVDAFTLQHLDGSVTPGEEPRAKDACVLVCTEAADHGVVEGKSPEVIDPRVRESSSRPITSLSKSLSRWKKARPKLVPHFFDGAPAVPRVGLD